MKIIWNIVANTTPNIDNFVFLYSLKGVQLSQPIIMNTKAKRLDVKEMKIYATINGTNTYTILLPPHPQNILQ